ncbi:hypothetical protein CVT26_009222 [Gymnopilus dilepis]|uniref:Uncharacterized protein n=1 Tax=Gymnopilus dilepis TaxID=231916 RepID=A0A409WCB8_9AGAR|nr:hypothetical protein CVT26_009222 [Gymnopilus dilepis]
MSPLQAPVQEQDITDRLDSDPLQTCQSPNTLYYPSMPRVAFKHAWAKTGIVLRTSDILIRSSTSEAEEASESIRLRHPDHIAQVSLWTPLTMPNTDPTKVRYFAQANVLVDGDWAHVLFKAFDYNQKPYSTTSAFHPIVLILLAETVKIPPLKRTGYRRQHINQQIGDYHEHTAFLCIDVHIAREALHGSYKYLLDRLRTLL